jgi:hypothetical protein
MWAGTVHAALGPGVANDRGGGGGAETMTVTTSVTVVGAADTVIVVGASVTVFVSVRISITVVVARDSEGKDEGARGGRSGGNKFKVSFSSATAIRAGGGMGIICAGAKSRVSAVDNGGV